MCECVEVSWMVYVDDSVSSSPPREKLLCCGLYGHSTVLLLVLFGLESVFPTEGSILDPCYDISR
jgi:hypothetical protein